MSRGDARLGIDDLRRAFRGAAILRRMGGVTVLLEAIRQGDQGARGSLFRTVYDELRKLARIRLARESTLTDLDAAGLVNEAYLRATIQMIVGMTPPQFKVTGRLLSRDGKRAVIFAESPPAQGGFAITVGDGAPPKPPEKMHRRCFAVQEGDAWK